MSVHAVRASCAFHIERVPVQLDGVGAAGFEVQAIDVLCYNVAMSAFSGKQHLERAQRAVRHVRLRARKLLKANQASDPISLLLRVVFHILLIRDGPVVRVAHVRAIAAPNAL